MAINYTVYPKTFEELVDSCRGQLERTRELAMKDKKIPLDEAVVITNEGFLAMLERIEQMEHMLREQVDINNSIQQIFYYLFSALGLPLDDEEDEDDEYGS
jgi:hypothetical protein